MLSFIFHLLHHSDIRLRSDWRQDTSWSLVTSRYKTQSSANKLIEDVTQEGKSLINIRKRRGPNTDPCGTPDVTGTKGEKQSFTNTNWERLVKKTRIQESNEGSMLRVLNLWSSSLCDTLSNALAKSKNIQSARELRSRIRWRSWLNVSNCVSHEKILRKPCCAAEKKLFDSRSFTSCE